MVSTVKVLYGEGKKKTAGWILRGSELLV